MECGTWNVEGLVGCIQNPGDGYVDLKWEGSDSESNL